MWQTGTASDYQDLLARLIQIATSQHVASAAVAAGGSGYTDGDILTHTQTSSTHPATFKATVVAGAVTAVTPIDGGAFDDQVSGAVVSAGGTGYAVGDFLEVSGGTTKRPCILEVTGVSGGVVTTVTVYEGGAYSATPSNPVATVALTGAGNDDATFTLTFTGAVDVTAVATTGGTGTGCTLDLTLADTGWETQRNEFWTYNSLDEREVVLLGEGSGSDEIFVGFRTFTVAVGLDTAYNLLTNGMTGFNSGLNYTAQPGISPGSTPGTGGGAYVPLENDSMDFWFSITGRRIIGIVKTADISTTHYMSLYAGFLNPFQTAGEYPYPIYISGCTARYDALWDTTIPDVGGICEQIGILNRHGPGYTRKANTVWESVINSVTQISPVDRINRFDFTLYPAGTSRLPSGGDNNLVVGDGNFSFEDLIPNSGVPGAPTIQVQETPDSGGDLFPLIPVTLVWTSSDGVDRSIVGHLDNVFWVPTAGVLSSEDTLEAGDYLVVQNGQRTQVSSYMAIKVE